MRRPSIPSPTTTWGAAVSDLRDGRINAVLNIPPEFSRKVLAGADPRIALISRQYGSVQLFGAYGKPHRTP